MNAKPTVSVVIPTCNRLDLLERSVTSALAQTYPALEIIVVNDAGAPVDKLLKKIDRDKLVKSVRHETNKGASGARNTGVRMAKGDYIAFLDDDDAWLPHHLATVVPALKASGKRFGYGLAEYVVDDMRDGQLVNVGRSQPYSHVPYSRERLLVANFIPTPTWVFERSLMEDVGYLDESFAMCEDWEWLIRASEKTDFLGVPQVTVEVRQRLHDSNHLIIQHRPKMNMWINRVYERHPAGDLTLELARTEHTNFGSATELTPEQDAKVRAAEAGARDGSLDLYGLFDVAAVLESANRRHQSIAIYRDWLAHADKPLRHAAWYNYGVVLQNLNRAADAEAAYRESLRQDPNFSLARLQLAALCERRGNVDEALSLWRIVVRQERASGSLSHTQAVNHLKRYLDV